MPSIVVGPLLRYVDESRATVFVETDSPCTVALVLGGPGTAPPVPTWSMHGHHYALAVLRDLEPGSATSYEVHLDDDRVWPEPASDWPPSVVRTLGGQGRFRLAFGSCRAVAEYDPVGLREHGADALAALAERIARQPYERWPDALMLLGDQIYADEPSPAMRARLRAAHQATAAGAGTPPDGTTATDTARDGSGARPVDPVDEEIHDFEEYTWLYRESWVDASPAVRWLLSTVPTAMILDDHDLRDDWNSSWSWRLDVQATAWFRDRAVGALGSYWVYQHLGNLSPEHLGQDRMYAQALAAGSDDERTAALDAFAWAADQDPPSARWSYVRDFGDVRLLVVDSRCSRRLDPDDRLMVDDAEWGWLAGHARGGGADHLLVATSLPVLLLRGIHDLEGWNEATAQGAWGRGYAWLGERLRRAVDLEHWAAFRRSFDALVSLIDEMGRRDDAPASVLLLSGDVHTSYTARATLPGVDDTRTAVHQLVQSPLRNPLNLPIRWANRLLGTRLAEHALGALARAAGVDDPAIHWRVDHGPWFDNGIMTLAFAGRDADLEVDRAAVSGDRQYLVRAAEVRLTGAQRRATPSRRAAMATAAATAGATLRSNAEGTT